MTMDYLLAGDIAINGGLGVPAITLAGGGQVISQVGPYKAEPYQGSAFQTILGGAAPPGEQQVAQAGIGGLAALIPGAIGALPGALGALGLSLPAWLAAILGVGVAGYGAYQALGGGEGGGLFGLNVLGGDQSMLGGVPFGGPGLAEPLLPYKEWHITINGVTLQFYSVKTARGRKMFCYNTKTKEWSHWTPQKMAVIGKNMPTHRAMVRLRHNLHRHTADARQILKITSPKSLRTPARHYGHRRH